MSEETPNSRDFRKQVGDYISNTFMVGSIRLALAMPYETRVRFFGWAVERTIGPLAGYRRRVLDNLQLIWPHLAKNERIRIAGACLNNLGRSFIENYSIDEFPARMAGNTPAGPGFAALEAAAASNRPVILVSGHYGNYEAARATLIGRGYNIGGLYRNMKNPYFNAHYVKTLESLGGPAFAQGLRGTASFVRHLKKGRQVVLLIDQHVFRAPRLDFLGVSANTALSAAELALRYDAELIPFYGIRQPDGLNFEIILEAPIPHSDTRTMTQTLNDSLAARVHANPEQWFWVHRRWRVRKEERVVTQDWK